MKHNLSIALLLLLAGLIVHLAAPSEAFSRSLGRWLERIGLKKVVMGGDKYEKAYDVIDEFLTKHVSSDNVEENLERAARWLHDETKHLQVSHKNLIEALTQFQEMQKLTLDTQKLCIRSSADILARNDAAARQPISRLKSTSTSTDTIEGSIDGENGAGPVGRRIDRIIYQLAVRHAEQCLDQYKRSFVELKSLVPVRTSEFVDEFFTEAIANHLRKIKINSPLKGHHLEENANEFIQQNPFETIAFIQQEISSFNGKNDAHDAIYEVIKFARRENDYNVRGLEIVDSYGEVYETLFNKAYKRYLVDNCVDYVNWFDRIFVPLVFDFQLREPTTMFNINDATDREMLHAMVLFEACSKFNTNPDSLKKNMIRLVKKLDALGI